MDLNGVNSQGTETKVDPMIFFLTAVYPFAEIVPPLYVCNLAQL